eukprot:14129514-Alexandrium_andersonii.AAC.1
MCRKASSPASWALRASADMGVAMVLRWPKASAARPTAWADFAEASLGCLRFSTPEAAKSSNK